MVKIYFVDADDGLPPADEIGIFITDQDGCTRVLPWWHSAIDQILCPLLFSRGDCWVWKAGIPLNNQPDDAVSNAGDRENAEMEQEDLDEEENHPYANEDPNNICPLLDDQPENDGEGEQLLLDQEEEFEAEIRDDHVAERMQQQEEVTEEEARQHHVSRTQAARYMLQIRTPPRNAGHDRRNPWHDPHWIFPFRRLFEYWCCLYNNRVERDKHQWYKRKQEQLRAEAPPRMVEGLERQRRRQNSMRT